jgi:predicted lactoylglutathione lyase
MEPRISILTLGVRDMERAYRFYHEGLGLPTSRNPEQGIVFFQMRGTVLALYPLEELAKDVSPELAPERSGFSGMTMAYNARSQEEVDDILQRAVEAGGSLVKPAQLVFWGGYSGYFADPDGHYWEVAYADSWQFHEDGSLVID